MKTNGYAARSAEEPLAPWSFERRATGPRDVAIDILFCWVCLSDLHTVRRVAGDRLPLRHRTRGYSKRIVVDHDFVLRVPDGLDPAGVAPLLCAGITTYSPLRHWKAGKGKKVGIVGLGGLGHMGVKLAHAFGAEVVLFTTSPGKREDARRLGASDVVVSRNADEMARHANSFDFILDTVSARHDLEGLLALLKRDATLTLVGAPPEPPTVNPFPLVMRRRRLAGSLIGGIPETQEMLDFCAERRLPADIEVIPIQDIEKAYARMVKGDVKYRFVIDMASLPA